MHDKGKVAELMHKPGGMSTVDRERGFEEVMGKEFPAIQIVARQYGMAVGDTPLIFDHGQVPQPAARTS